MTMKTRAIIKFGKFQDSFVRLDMNLVHLASTLNPAIFRIFIDVEEELTGVEDEKNDVFISSLKYLYWGGETIASSSNISQPDEYNIMALDEDYALAIGLRDGAIIRFEFVFEEIIKAKSVNLVPKDYASWEFANENCQKLESQILNQCRIIKVGSPLLVKYEQLCMTFDPVSINNNDADDDVALMGDKTELIIAAFEGERSSCPSSFYLKLNVNVACDEFSSIALPESMWKEYKKNSKQGRLVVEFSPVLQSSRESIVFHASKVSSWHQDGEVAISKDFHQQLQFNLKLPKKDNGSGSLLLLDGMLMYFRLVSALPISNASDLEFVIYCPLQRSRKERDAVIREIESFLYSKIQENNDRLVLSNERLIQVSSQLFFKVSFKDQETEAVVVIPKNILLSDFKIEILPLMGGPLSEHLFSENLLRHDFFVEPGFYIQKSFSLKSIVPFSSSLQKYLSNRETATLALDGKSDFTSIEKILYKRLCIASKFHEKAVILIENFDEFERTQNCHRHRKLINLISKLKCKYSPLVLIAMGSSELKCCFKDLGLRSIDLNSNSIESQSGLKDLKVAGFEGAVEIINRTISVPVRYSRLFEVNKIECQSGILLYGYPGCGKTFLANALKSLDIEFIPVKGPEVLSKYIGSSEEAIRNIFRRAKQKTPSIIFFDEFDSIAPKRGNDQAGVTDRLVNQLLTELDGVDGRKGVFVVAASSRPDLIDPALLRGGRLGDKIFLDFPDSNGIKEILRNISLDYYSGIENDLIEEISDALAGSSPADLVALMKSAYEIACSEEYNLEWSMESLKQSKNEVRKYEIRDKNFGEARDENLIGKNDGKRVKILRDHIFKALEQFSFSLSKKDRIFYEKIFHLFRHPAAIKDMEIVDARKGAKSVCQCSWNGNHILCVSSEEKLLITVNDSLCQIINFDSNIQCASINSSAQIAVSMGKSVFLYNVIEGGEKLFWTRNNFVSIQEENDIQILAWIGNDQMAIYSATLRIWNVATSLFEREYLFRSDLKVRKVSVSDDKRFLGFISDDCFVRIVDLRDESRFKVIYLFHSRKVADFQWFSNDTKREKEYCIMSYDEFSCIRIWQKVSWANEFTLVGIVDVGKKFPISAGSLGCCFMVPLSHDVFEASSHLTENSHVLFHLHPEGCIMTWIIEYDYSSRKLNQVNFYSQTSKFSNVNFDAMKVVSVRWGDDFGMITCYLHNGSTLSISKLDIDVRKMMNIHGFNASCICVKKVLPELSKCASAWIKKFPSFNLVVSWNDEIVQYLSEKDDGSSTLVFHHQLSHVPVLVEVYSFQGELYALVVCSNELLYHIHISGLAFKAMKFAPGSSFVPLLDVKLLQRKWSQSKFLGLDLINQELCCLTVNHSEDQEDDDLVSIQSIPERKYLTAYAFGPQQYFEIEFWDSPKLFCLLSKDKKLENFILVLMMDDVISVINFSDHLRFKGSSIFHLSMSQDLAYVNAKGNLEIAEINNISASASFHEVEKFSSASNIVDLCWKNIPGLSANCLFVCQKSCISLVIKSSGKYREIAKFDIRHIDLSFFSLEKSNLPYLSFESDNLILRKHLYSFSRGLKSDFHILNPQSCLALLLMGKLNRVEYLLSEIVKNIESQNEEEDGQQLKYLFLDDSSQAQANEFLTEISKKILLEVYAPSLEEEDRVTLEFILQVLGEVKEVAASLDENGKIFFLHMKHHIFQRKRGKHSDPMDLRHILFAYYSKSQETLVTKILDMFKGPVKLLWKDFSDFGMGFWINNPNTLKKILDGIARDTFMGNGSGEKDPVACSIFYIAMKKAKLLQGLWKTCSNHPEKGKTMEFLSHDFEDPKWKAAALKNAFALLGKQRFEYSAAFFLLGGELKDAANVCVRNLQDYQLAITICRLYEGELGTSLKIVLRDVILAHAQETGKPMLRIMCHAMLNEREEILNTLKSGIVTADFTSEMLLLYHDGGSLEPEFLLNMAHEWTKKHLLLIAFMYIERLGKFQTSSASTSSTTLKMGLILSKVLILLFTSISISDSNLNLFLGQFSTKFPEISQEKICQIINGLLFGSMRLKKADLLISMESSLSKNDDFVNEIFLSLWKECLLESLDKETLCNTLQDLSDSTKKKCICLAFFIAILLDSNDNEKVEGYLDVIQKICDPGATSKNEDLAQYVNAIKSFSFHPSNFGLSDKSEIWKSLLYPHLCRYFKSFHGRQAKHQIEIDESILRQIEQFPKIRTTTAMANDFGSSKDCITLYESQQTILDILILQKSIVVLCESAIIEVAKSSQPKNQQSPFQRECDVVAIGGSVHFNHYITCGSDNIFNLWRVGEPESLSSIVVSSLKRVSGIKLNDCATRLLATDRSNNVLVVRVDLKMHVMELLMVLSEEKLRDIQFFGFCHCNNVVYMSGNSTETKFNGILLQSDVLYQKSNRINIEDYEKNGESFKRILKCNDQTLLVFMTSGKVSVVQGSVAESLEGEIPNSSMAEPLCCGLKGKEDDACYQVLFSNGQILTFDLTEKRILMENRISLPLNQSSNSSPKKNNGNLFSKAKCEFNNVFSTTCSNTVYYYVVEGSVLQKITL